MYATVLLCTNMRDGDHRRRLHFRLNSEMIWKIQKKSKLNSEKIWKKQKKGKLNSEKIWKLWKKSRLNSEMIWKNME